MVNANACDLWHQSFPFILYCFLQEVIAVKLIQVILVHEVTKIISYSSCFLFDCFTFMIQIN